MVLPYLEAIYIYSTAKVLNNSELLSFNLAQIDWDSYPIACLTSMGQTMPLEFNFNLYAGIVQWFGHPVFEIISDNLGFSSSFKI